MSQFINLHYNRGCNNAMTFVGSLETQLAIITLLMTGIKTWINRGFNSCSILKSLSFSPLQNRISNLFMARLLLPAVHLIRHSDPAFLPPPLKYEALAKNNRGKKSRSFDPCLGEVSRNFLPDAPNFRGSRGLSLRGVRKCKLWLNFPRPLRASTSSFMALKQPWHGCYAFYILTNFVGSAAV